MWCVSVGIYRTLDLFLVNMGQLFEVQGLRNPPRIVQTKSLVQVGPTEALEPPSQAWAKRCCFQKGVRQGFLLQSTTQNKDTQATPVLLRDFYWVKGSCF